MLKMESTKGQKVLKVVPLYFLTKVHVLPKGNRKYCQRFSPSDMGFDLTQILKINVHRGIRLPYAMVAS